LITTSGTYSVTVTDDIGCSASNSIIVTVNPWPSISITGDLILCEGESTTLTASGSDSYLWEGGLTSSSITVSPTETTTYTVTGTDANNCTATYPIAVTVNPLPTPSIEGNIVLCEGESTTLTASGGKSYLWEGGQTSSSITVSPTETTTYTVTVTDNNGCIASATTTVTVFDNPQVDIDMTTGTENCTAILTANPNTEVYTYEWIPNNETTSEITVSAPGNYAVVITDTNGCTDCTVAIHRITTSLVSFAR